MSHRRRTNRGGILSRHPGLTKSFLVFNDDLRMVKATGLTDAEFSAISAGPDSPVRGEFEAAALGVPDEIVADRYVSDATWAASSWTRPRGLPIRVRQLTPNRVPADLHVPRAEDDPRRIHDCRLKGEIR
jgi:hypothetical protein